MRYEVTPRLSVAAPQATWTWPSLVSLAVTPAGALGATVSGIATATAAGVPTLPVASTADTV